MAPSDHQHREAPPMIGPPGTFPRVKKNQCESPTKLSTSSTFSSSSSQSSSSSSSSSTSSCSSTCSTISRVSYRKRCNSETSLATVKSKSVVASGSKKFQKKFFFSTFFVSDFCFWLLSFAERSDLSRETTTTLKI